MAFPETNLIARWLFNENTGTVAASEVGTYDLTFNGDAAWSGAKVEGDSALGLEGAGFLELPHAAAFAPVETLSLAFWVYADWATAPLADECIISKYTATTGYRLRRTTFNSLVFEWPTSTSNYIGCRCDAFSAGWHHIAITFGGNYAQLYVDGVLRGYRTYLSTTKMVAGTNSLLVGAQPSATTGVDTTPMYFTGIVDDLAFWSRTLTATDVADAFAVGGITTGYVRRSKPFIGGKEAYWPLSSVDIDGLFRSERYDLTSAAGRFSYRDYYSGSLVMTNEVVIANEASFVSDGADELRQTGSTTNMNWLFPTRGSTWSLWAYQGNWESVQGYLWGHAATYHWVKFTNGFISARVRTSSETKTTSNYDVRGLAPGWHFFTLVFDNVNINLYVDASLVQATALNTPLVMLVRSDLDTFAISHVGAPNGNSISPPSDDNMAGIFSSLAIHQYPLTAQNVQDLYAATTFDITALNFLSTTTSCRYGAEYYLTRTESLSISETIEGLAAIMLRETAEFIDPIAWSHDGESSSLWYEKVIERHVQSVEAIDTAVLLEAITNAVSLYVQGLQLSGFYDALVEQITLDHVLSDIEALQLIEAVTILESFSSAGSTLNRFVAENIRVRDVLLFAWLNVITDGITSEETLDSLLSKIISVIEKVFGSEVLQPSVYFNVEEIVYSTVASFLASGKGGSLLDGVEIEIELISKLTALHAFSEKANLSSVTENSCRLSLVSPERLDLSGTAATSAVVQNLLADGVMFALSFGLGDAIYTGWVMNTKNFAVTEYQNFPFNSFCKIGSAYLGANSEGLYVLEGADDAGTNIDATFSLGITDFGSDKLKELDSIYLGFKLNGDMLLKTISEDGVERVYTVTGDTTKLHTRRVHPLAKGLRAMYWQLEMSNVDGVDFELDTVEFMPVVLSRRVR